MAGVRGSVQPAMEPFGCCIGMQPPVVFIHGATVACTVYGAAAVSAVTALLSATVTETAAVPEATNP